MGPDLLHIHTALAGQEDEEVVFGDLRLVSACMLICSIIFKSFLFLFSFDF